MPDPTVSQLCRTVQRDLSTLNDVLATTLSLALDIGIVSFRLAHLEAAMNDNQHAWNELGQLATALELTGADHKL